MDIKGYQYGVDAGILIQSLNDTIPQFITAEGENPNLMHRETFFIIPQEDFYLVP